MPENSLGTWTLRQSAWTGSLLDMQIESAESDVSFKISNVEWIWSEFNGFILFYIFVCGDPNSETYCSSFVFFFLNGDHRIGLLS